jgi:hypothetical protein
MKVASHNPKPDQALLFQGLDSIKERLDFLELLSRQWHLLPSVIDD